MVSISWLEKKRPQVDSYTGDFFFIFRVASLIKGLATVLDIKAQLLWKSIELGSMASALDAVDPASQIGDVWFLFEHGATWWTRTPT